MPLPNMNAWEHRADFPSLCMKVSCPTCHARIGERCRDMSVARHVMSAVRKDFHAERKYLAIHAAENPLALEGPDAA